MKQKIKWSYDKDFKQWWTPETTPWSNNGFTIRRYKSGEYRLSQGRTIGRFKKLSSAKQVAHLLMFG